MARLLEEPVAAAVAHDALLKKNAAEKKKKTKRERDDGGALVLVYDLGGGTLDVAVLRSEPSSGTFLVMGSAGDDRLGGEDFDRALLQWAREKLSSLPEPIFFPDARDAERDARVRGGGRRRAERRMTRTIVPVIGTRLSSRQTPRGLTRAAFTSARSARWNSPRDT